MRRRRHDDWFACPHCGAEVRAGAKFCRECGASEESGWDEKDDQPEEAGYAEDDDFDYDEFLRREFPGEAPSRSARGQTKRVLLWIVVVLLIVSFLCWAVL